MKVGVFTAVYNDRGCDEMLDKLAGFGVEAVELGTGNSAADKHVGMDELLAEPAKAAAFKRKLDERGITISALSQHGNPVHPDPAEAAHDHGIWVKTLQLAELLEVEVVNAFSGCPGGSPADRTPNWITCTWPDDFAHALRYQWDEVLIPYWGAQLEPMRRHGVKVAIEPHPGFAVYNTETMLRLRAATGEAVGCNYDPSHLFWQGIDPFASIKALGRAIHHVHAKDTFLDAGNVAVNGVLDTKSYTRLSERSWYFRTIGFGQGEQVWRDIVSALRLVGYDWVVSIEHEDGLLSKDEGLRKAIDLLQSIAPAEPTGSMWWA